MPSAQREGALVTELEGIDTERRRQAQLLRTLWRQSPDAGLAGWLRPGPVGAARALAAYRGNGEGLAARALAASHPTLAQLVGDDTFAALARGYWRAHPPLAGDMACYGAGLADWIAADTRLADEPYLADCARLDWAVHRIASAPDLAPSPEGLALLGGPDPEHLYLVPRPGLALLDSRWPVVTLWQAHRRDDPDRFVPVREAFARQQAEAALVWREGWRPRVEVPATGEAVFMRALLAAQPLGVALEQAQAVPAHAGDEPFAFEPWLIKALQQGWLAAVRPGPAEPALGGP